MSKISSPAFSQILSSLTMAAFSGAPFSDQVCKSVDCCYYQQIEQVSASMGDGPNNFYKNKVLPGLDKCTVPVPKTCKQQATIILS